ncbi:hypothetical protein [Streptomyces sp. NPDC056544]|uniref:hypothetical protein n=1 Tax=unclassified Streptomyces TaxID=2593676 RepID=UPI003684220A
MRQMDDWCYSSLEIIGLATRLELSAVLQKLPPETQVMAAISEPSPEAAPIGEIRERHKGALWAWLSDAKSLIFDDAGVIQLPAAEKGLEFSWSKCSPPGTRASLR